MGSSMLLSALLLLGVCVCVCVCEGGRAQGCSGSCSEQEALLPAALLVQARARLLPSAASSASCSSASCPAGLAPQSPCAWDPPAALLLASHALHLQLQMQRQQDVQGRQLDPSIAVLHEVVGLLQALLGMSTHSTASFATALAQDTYSPSSRMRLLLHHAFSFLVAGQRSSARNALELVISSSTRSDDDKDTSEALQLLLARAYGARALLELEEGHPAAALQQLVVAGNFSNVSNSARQLKSRLQVLQGRCYMQLGLFWQARWSFLQARQLVEGYGAQQGKEVGDLLRTSCHLLVMDSRHLELQSREELLRRPHDASFHSAIADDDIRQQLCEEGGDKGGDLQRDALPERQKKYEVTLPDSWGSLLLASRRLACRTFYMSHEPSLAGRFCANRRRAAALFLASVQIKRGIQRTAPRYEGIDHVESMEDVNELDLPVKLCDPRSVTASVLDVHSIALPLLCNSVGPNFLDLADSALSWFIASHPIKSSNRNLVEFMGDLATPDSVDDRRRLYFVKDGGAVVEHVHYLERIFDYCRRHILKRGFVRVESSNSTGDERDFWVLPNSHHDRVKIQKSTTFEELVGAVNSSFHVAFRIQKETDTRNFHTSWDLYVNMQPYSPSAKRSPSSTLSVYLSLNPTLIGNGNTDSKNALIYLQEALQIAYRVYLSADGGLSKIKGALNVFYHWVHLSPLQSLQQNDFMGASWLLASLPSIVSTSCPDMGTAAGQCDLNREIRYSSGHLYIEALFTSSAADFINNFCMKWTHTESSLPESPSVDDAVPDLVDLLNSIGGPSTSVADMSVFLSRATELLIEYEERDDKSNQYAETFPNADLQSLPLQSAQLPLPRLELSHESTEHSHFPSLATIVNNAVHALVLAREEGNATMSPIGEEGDLFNSRVCSDDDDEYTWVDFDKDSDGNGSVGGFDSNHIADIASDSATLDDDNYYYYYYTDYVEDYEGVAYRGGVMTDDASGDFTEHYYYYYYHYYDDDYDSASGDTGYVDNSRAGTYQEYEAEGDLKTDGNYEVESDSYYYYYYYGNDFGPDGTGNSGEVVADGNDYYYYSSDDYIADYGNDDSLSDSGIEMHEVDGSYYYYYYYDYHYYGTDGIDADGGGDGIAFDSGDSGGGTDIHHENNYFYYNNPAGYASDDDAKYAGGGEYYYYYNYYYY